MTCVLYIVKLASAELHMITTKYFSFLPRNQNFIFGMKNNDEKSLLTNIH